MRQRPFSIGVGAWILAAILLLAVPSRAQASTISYANRTAWETATPGFTNITFDGAPTNSFISYGFGPALFSGVSFNTFGSLFTIDPTLNPSRYDWGSGDILSNQGVNLPMTVTLPTGVTSVGFDFMTLSTDATGALVFGDTVQITLSTGEFFLLSSLQYPNRAFAGFISTTPITSLTIRASTYSHLFLDNFAFGQGAAAAPVPEPASLLLLASGLGAVAARLRFTKRQ